MAACIRVAGGKTQHQNDYHIAVPVPLSSRRRPQKIPVRIATSHTCSQLSTRRLTYSTKTERRHSIIAHGILDAYRKDKGLLERQREAFKQSNEARQPAASEEDDEVCPAECVREINTVEDLDKELHQGGDNTLVNDSSAGQKTQVVVDFYKTACGSCRYIQPGFVKLCQASEAGHAAVVFLKHNIFDEYEELSDLSQKYKIRSVPMFMFWKGGEVVEQFATRERVRVAQAINKHAGYEVLEPK